MTKDSQDEIARAYAMLSALRKNISQMTDYSIEEKYVNEFHSVLTKLEDVGIDVSDFRILGLEVKPRLLSEGYGYSPGEKRYSEEKYVERSYILTKLDAVLSYLKIITSEKPKRIGFRTSQD